MEMLMAHSTSQHMYTQARPENHRKELEEGNKPPKQKREHKGCVYDGIVDC